MLNLLRIEVLKSICRKSVWISLICCVVLILGFAWFLSKDWDFGDRTEEESSVEEQFKNATDWKERLELQMQLNQFNESVYGKDVVEVQNELLRYRIDNNIKPNDKNTTWDFISYSYEMLNIVIAIFAVIFGVEIVTMEYSNKTIKSLYMKPYSRTNILSSKYLLSVFYVFILTMVTTMAAWLTGGFFFSFGGLSSITVIRLFDSIFTVTAMEEGLILGFSCILKALIIMTFAFCLAIISKNQIFSTLCSLGLLFFGKKIMLKIVDSGHEWAKYSLLANFDLSGFINRPIPEGITPIIVVFIVLIHVVILLGAAFYWNVKMDV